MTDGHRCCRAATSYKEPDLNLAAHLRYEHRWSWRRLNEEFKPTWWSVRDWRSAVEHTAENMGYVEDRP